MLRLEKVNGKKRLGYTKAESIGVTEKFCRS